jgi:S1-C subfamily serine protease
VGDWVLAYGSPVGLQGTATVGIISALRPGWVQTDAQINQGNSGGPLVDRDGRVLGVTSLGFARGGSGLGFAVDARKLCPLVTGMTGCA